MFTRPFAWLATAALLCACASSPTPSTPPAGNDASTPDVAQPADVAAPTDTARPTDATVIATETREVTMPPQTLMPGQEVTMCREVRLGNSDAMLVRNIRVSIPRGSHHVIVYRSRATAEQLTPTRCRGLSGIQMGTAPIFIAQQHESGIDFPDGVGLSIGADQMIRIEEHFINPTAAPITADARITFTLARAEGLTRADLMFWGTQNINIPPRMTGTARHFAVAPEGVNVLGLTSHTHERGTLATVEVATSLQGPGREIHRSTDWAEPPLTLFTPPMTLAEGEGFRLVCNYNNTSDQTLRFGESFYQEMCFMWAYYYPSIGFHVCLDGLCRALPF